MKKQNRIIYCLLVSFSIILLTGCGISNVQNKTEYNIKEKATIDNYQLVCNNYEIKDNILKVNLELLNKNKQDKTISLINNFEIINIIDNEIIPKNISSEKVEIVKDNESISIELKFDIKDIDFNITDYKIIFYSGVATNNIAFILEEE